MQPGSPLAVLLPGILLGAALAAGGCTTPRSANGRTGPVSMTPQTKDVDGEAAWDRILKEHTRRSEVYDLPIRQADMRATLVTPRLRKAFIDARDEFHGRFSRDTSRELLWLGQPDEGVDAAMRPAPESEQQVLVFVAMYVTDRKNRDIAASYTIWDTNLVRGDVSVAPVAIETLRNTPAVVDVFPYVDRFDDVYLLRFPLVDPEGRPLLSPGGEPVRLEVKSALAECVVEWALRE